ncbi:MAG: sulfotransferase [Bacteroidetes bacterium]|nr:sulfotransferase [Bacteroidota bacterium]
MVDSAPFFIIGTPRSGTTLLSVLLGNHPAIYIDGDSVGLSLVRDFRRMKSAWQNKPLQDKKALWSRICKSSYKQRLDRIFDAEKLEAYPHFQQYLTGSLQAFAERHNKKIWGDKTPELIHHLPEILELFPEARFIQMVRDSRPNVSSLVKRQYYPLSLATQYWKDINGLGLYYRNLMPENRFRILKYEDLLTQPEESIKEICAFLKIPFEAEILDLDRSEATGSKDSYVQSSIRADKLEAWRKTLGEKDIRKIESICADTMEALDYPRDIFKDSAKARSLSAWKQFWLRQQLIFRMLFKGRREVMIDRKLIRQKISLKVRLKNFLFATVKQFFSEDFIRAFKR